MIMKHKKAVPVPENGILIDSGYYYLERDFITTSPLGIRIDGSFVKLDLNGFSIINECDQGNGFNVVVYALNSNFFEIYNGLIKGAAIGIHAPYSQSLNISNLTIEHCRRIGINFGGSGASITNCLIKDIRGSREDAYAIGINSSEALGAKISYNRIENIYRQNVSNDLIGEGVGILLGHDSANCELLGNIISNNLQASHTFGIWAVGKKHLLYRNIIINHQMGIYTGDSKLHRNIIALENYNSDSAGISGGMARCEHNTILNYGRDYHQSLQEEVTRNEPFIIT